jgi:predicted dithiol-disulfide oxidoreductase (DUF899 family)
MHDKRFPNESPAYRSARNELLRAEVELRAHVEKVAEQRRRLPASGKVKEDYVFERMRPDGAVESVRLSELFAPGKDSLVVYSFMYGPKAEAACPSCTSLIDGFDATAPHILQRVNMVVVAKSPIERIVDHARGRGPALAPVEHLRPDARRPGHRLVSEAVVLIARPLKLARPGVVQSRDTIANTRSFRSY